MSAVRVLIMRHARSEFNEITIRSMETPAVFRASFLKDSKLSFKGFTDCKELARSIKDAGIKLVFVSPYRRCLETARYLFEDLPPARRPRIVVNPNIMERISKSSEVPHYYPKAMTLPHYQHFDFTHMRQMMALPFWDLPMHAAEKDLLEELLRMRGETALKGHILKFSYLRRQTEGPHRNIEQHLLQRIEAFNEELRLYIANFRLTEALGPNQILLISHFNWIMSYVQLNKQQIPDFDCALMNLKTFSVELNLD